MKNIVLIGMSGSGKSSVGKFISKVTSMKYLDTDEMLVDKNNMDISYIFHRYGERYFRELEKEIIKDVSGKTWSVISTGGGVVMDMANISLLKENGVIFLLRASLDTLVNNLKGSDWNHRPLLSKNKGIFDQVAKLYKDRRNLYINSADYVVDTDNKTIEEVSEYIINKFEKLTVDVKIRD